MDDWLDRQWAATPEAFSVDVDGTRIACQGWNLAAGHLPGIVLVHGFRAHLHWWDHIAPSFVDRYRVVALSLSGMGDSGRRAAYSRAGFGRDILGVAAACGFDPAIVIAHSFGGISALLAAHAEPSRMARLIVIDSGLKAQDEDEGEIPAVPTRFYPTRDAALARFRLMPPSPCPQPRVLDYIAQHSVREEPQGWTWKFDPNLASSLNTDPHRSAYPLVPVPVDVIVGEHTSVMTPPRLAELYRIAPDCGRSVVIPASEHHVMIDQPVALVAALHALLANDRSPSAR